MLAISIELPNAHSRLGSQVHKSLGLREWRMLAPELVRRSSGQHETTLPCTMALLAAPSWASGPPPTNTRAGRKTRRPKRRTYTGQHALVQCARVQMRGRMNEVGPHKSIGIHDSSNATNIVTIDQDSKTRVHRRARRITKGILNSCVAPREGAKPRYFRRTNAISKSHTKPTKTQQIPVE